MRPCKHSEIVETCSACQLYLSRADYREIWDAPEPSAIEVAQPPGLLRKAASFRDSYSQWKEAGKPRTPPEDMLRRREICNACEFLDKASDSCLRCGCPLKEAGLLVSLLTDAPGKLEMATEKCPVGKWEPINAP